MKSWCIIILVLCLPVISGCSASRLAANQMTLNVVRAMPAYDRETDLELAEHAAAANLKFLEGLLEITPDNSDLLVATARSFSRYAYGFIEGEIQIADEESDFEEKKRLTARALDFYSRAKRYGLRSLGQNRKAFAVPAELDDSQFALELEYLRKEDVPALFWTTFAWGNMIRLDQNNPDRLVELPKVKSMMDRILELDEMYFYGGAHLLLSTFYSNLPALFGGNLAEARAHLERAIEISDGKYLLARFLLATGYSVPAQDRNLYEQTLKEIISAPPDLLPEQGLDNQIAKQRAARLIRRIDKLFP